MSQPAQAAEQQPATADVAPTTDDTTSAATAQPAERQPKPQPEPQPKPRELYEPARDFAKKTKLRLYHYHLERIGNVQGYLAPMIQTSDGGFVVVGTRRPPGRYRPRVSRPVVAKLNARGERQWEKSYRVPAFADYEGASAVELDDGYIVYILSYIKPSSSAVARLLRIDLKGKVVWDVRLRADGRAGTPHPQNVRLHDGKLLLDGHIYKDATETAYGWKGEVSLEGKVLRDEVGAANPYD